MNKLPISILSLVFLISSASVMNIMGCSKDFFAPNQTPTLTPEQLQMFALLANVHLNRPTPPQNPTNVSSVSNGNSSPAV
jgi:hypothetical protein